jgi:dephospho-CoA kinase
MAKESMEHAVQRQQAEYEADVQRAAAILVERQKREALEQQVADAVAASEKAIAKLRKEAEAELARLTK